jgi:DNA polymerase
LLPRIAGGGEFVHGPVTISLEQVKLPSGLYLHYPEITSDGDGGYKYRHWSHNKWEWAKIYGAKLTENIVQALARQLLCEQQNILEKRYRVVHQVHDELVFIVPDWQVAEAREVMMRVMAVPPAWMPELPLEAEVHIAQNFGECK